MMVAGDRHLDRTGAGLGRTHQRAEADRRAQRGRRAVYPATRGYAACSHKLAPT